MIMLTDTRAVMIVQMIFTVFGFILAAPKRRFF